MISPTFCIYPQYYAAFTYTLKIDQTMDSTTDLITSPIAYLNTFPHLLIFTVIIFLIILNYSFQKSLKLPPGPFPWPIVGNIFEVSKTHPHIALAQLAEKYGPIMSLRLGRQVLIVGSSPAVASQILKTNDRVLSGRHLPLPIRFKGSKLHNLGLGFSDECDDGWTSFRTIYRGEIFSAKALNLQVSLREQKVMEMVNYLKSKEGQVVKLKDVIFATALNILSNTFLSVDFLDYEGKGFGEGMKGQIRRFGVAGTAETLSDLFPILDGLSLDFQRMCNQMADAVGKIFESWAQIVKQRRNVGSVNEIHSRRDFVDVLLQSGFKDEQINPMILELFSAGTDSTSATSEWVLLELIKNPKAMNKLRNEVSKTIKGGKVKESDLSNMPYLDACLKETLRLHPPGPLLLPHRATQTCEIMGYSIPKDSQVLVNMWAIGRDPTIWDDPTTFKPERFLLSVLDFKGQDFEYIPFGSGRRMCPGLPLATKVIPLIVASVVNELDYTLPNGMDPSNIDVSEMYDITMQKKEPFCIVPMLRKQVVQ